MKYYSRIRSRHPSHNAFRKYFQFNKRTVIRFGSTTIEPECQYEINSIEAVKTSSNKLLMKEAFTAHGVVTADWFISSRYNQNTFLSMKEFLNSQLEGDGEDILINQLPYPIVAKSLYGSRNLGNTLINNQEEFESWIQGKILSNYIFEKYYNYSREYRIHVDKNECFYTCRKMLKSDATERWFRNDSNSVWILEENEAFDKPVNFDEIISESIKALNAVGLDFAAIDVRVQSSKDKNGEFRDSPDFIILETNSAPSMGQITEIKYKQQIPKILKNKYNDIISYNAVIHNTAIQDN
jgi:glutathione synthase/RimK-type ligase-like ATP-grasp enzyme